MRVDFHAHCVLSCYKLLKLYVLYETVLHPCMYVKAVQRGVAMTARNNFMRAYWGLFI